MFLASVPDDSVRYSIEKFFYDGETGDRDWESARIRTFPARQNWIWKGPKPVLLDYLGMMKMSSVDDVCAITI